MSVQERDRSPAVAMAEAFKDLSVGRVSLETDDDSLDIETMTVDQRLQQARRLTVLGEDLLTSYRHSKRGEDIEGSVKAYGQAVRLAGKDSQLLNYHYDYAIALLERYNFLQNIGDIDLAISMVQRVVEATSDESNDLTRRSGFLSSLHYIRYRSNKDISDLSQAIDTMRKSIHTNTGDERMISNLNNISVFLHQRFQLSSSHDLADISEAISFQHQLVALTPENDGNQPTWLEKLGAFFLDRFQYTGELDDLSEAIFALDKAIQISPGHDVHKIRRLGKRGILYRQRSHYGGTVSDIYHAVNDHQEALRIAPDDYVDLYELLENLGNSYLSMYEQTEDPEHISEALAALQNAVNFIPDGDPDTPFYWSNLGSALLRRFEFTGNSQDISEAISAQEQSVQLASPDNVKFPSLLNNLGHSYQIRFDISGDILDITEAITAHQKSIQLTSESHVDMPGRLNNLGIALQCRADRTGDIVDIWEAIDAHKRAVELCRPGHGLMRVFLSNLGNSIFARFTIEKDPKDIDEAISLYERAINLTGKEDTTTADNHHNLSLALRNRFSLINNLKDLDEAVFSAELALELTPQDHSSYIIKRLSSLATVLCTRYEHFKLPADISRAIISLENAINLLPSDHPLLSVLIFNMGHCMETRFTLENNLIDLETAYNKFKKATSLTFGLPSMRLRAAIHWATTAKLLDRSGVKSIEAYEMVMSLISEVVGMDKTVGLRYRTLFNTSFSDLSNEAAAAAFECHKLEYALEWLEQGRCTVWTHLHNLRTPLDNLAYHDPKLAEDLSQVGRDLDAAGLRNEHVPVGVDPNIMVEKIALQDEATANVRLVQEWDALLAEARCIPGFEDFLKPVQYRDIIGKTPENGYVVVINIHPDRCDAIAIRGSEKGALHIPLNSFTYDDAVRLVRLQETVLASHRTRTDEHEVDIQEETRGSRPYLGSSNPMQAILGELWVGVVNPVLQALGILSTSGELKRFWWCPTGPLCFLPIHAAGIYNSRHNMCVSDFVVSSYTPTVSSLVESTRASGVQRLEDSKVLIIGQEDAPGLQPLPGAKKEVEVLKQKFSSADVQFSCLEGSTATMEGAVMEMATHNFIHLACHAIQDTNHPLNSGFYLSDGRLELWTMLKIYSRHAEFAFLSACQTARGNGWLSEEVVHLGAGMLAVGYKSVVATMWSIQDRYGVKIAEDFYSDLLDKREEEINTTRRFGPAGSLHYAVGRLRADIGDSPSAMLAWIPYMHMGV